MSSNVTNAIAQTNYSFAIWDISGGAPTDPDGGAAPLIRAAFRAVVGGYLASDVTVYTPLNHSVSQEFLVVTPEPAAAAILSFDLLSVLAILFILCRYRVRV